MEVVLKILIKKIDGNSKVSVCKCWKNYNFKLFQVICLTRSWHAERSYRKTAPKTNRNIFVKDIYWYAEKHEKVFSRFLSSHGFLFFWIIEDNEEKGELKQIEVEKFTGRAKWQWVRWTMSLVRFFKDLNYAAVINKVSFISSARLLHDWEDER